MEKITRYILRYWYVYIIAILFMVIQVSLDMLSPQVTKSIIDDVVGDGRLEILPWLLAIIFFIGAGRFVFGYLKESMFDRVSSSIAVKIRKNLFCHIQSLSVDFFDRTNTGELMSRVKDDVDKIQNAVGFIGMLVIEVTVHTTIVLWCMFRLSTKLFIIPLIAMPLVACFAILMERKLDGIYSEISEENAVLNTVAQENLAGVRTVKAFAREKFEIQKFLSHNRRYYELNMAQSKVLVRYQPLFQLVTKLLPLIAVIYGGFLVIDGDITLGTLGAFIEYCTNIVWPMEMLGWLLNDFAAAFASSKKLKKIYAQTSQIKEQENPVILEQVNGDIVFEHVSWNAGGKDILKDVSFHLPAGKTLGIMGMTGSGKTSVIHLLQRFYETNRGTIRLDGTDIRKMSLEQLRLSISPVMQDVFLFSDTITANVELGRREKTGGYEVENALEEACAREFIEKLSDRYETLIGERGVGLSGGQKQRISIARALVRHAPVLVLDDATSALDMETEKKIQKTLEQFKDTTKIIVAHRISAVKSADEIIVLDEGKVVERGTHKSLLEEKGYYYQTWLAQYGELFTQDEKKGVSYGS